MTSRENRVQCAAEIPIETKQALKDADAPIWKLLDEGARIVLGLDEGSTEAALEHRLEEIRSERNEISDQLQILESRLDDLEEMEADIEDRLAGVRERKQSHKERLDEILESMEADSRNRPFMAWMPDVRDAAVKEYGSESKENIRRVVEDLRKQATQENFAVGHDRLSRNAPTQQSTPSAADGGVDQDSEFRALNGHSDE